MLRFFSNLASKVSTNNQLVHCSTWSRNYAAADSKRFFDCTRFKKDLVEVMYNCDEPTSKEDYSPMRKEVPDGRQLRQGAKMALDSVLGNLSSRAQHITTFEEIAEYATAALNGDREIGELIAKAFEKGWENNLHIKADGKITNNALMLYNGMILDRGYLFPHFITTQTRKEYVLQSADVLILEKKLLNYGIMFDLLRSVAPRRGYKGRDILIVAEDVENDLLATLILHGMCTGTKVFFIKPPGFGESRKAILQEIVKITRGQVITEDFCNCSFGYALEIMVSKDQTIILQSPCGEHAKRSTVENLHDFPAKHPTKHSNTLAVLQVSGANKTELRKKKNSVTSAVNAVKAAKEGVGSGLSLLYALNELDKLKTTNYGQKIGVQTIKDALETLLLNIIASTVGVKTSVIFDNLVKLENLDPEDYMREGGYAIIPFPKLDKLLMQDNPIFGYDPAKGEYVDMVVRSETVFPLKTLRTVLVQATSEMLTRR